MEDRYHLEDDRQDILSHPSRGHIIHILTLDPILANDVYERIHNDKRMKYYQLIKPRNTDLREAVLEIDNMAKDTVFSRLLIIDVRRLTLPKLQRAYNKVVGYNRRDLNKLCHIILIGDGPFDLFSKGKSLDVFVPYISTHRVDFHPAAFFYDPFLHYEHSEIERAGVDDEFVLPNKIPQRLARYFKKDDDVRVDKIRHYFRAIDKPEEICKKRLRRLKSIYKKRMAEAFPDRKDQLREWRSRKGLRLASEKLNLYPFYFEDWVYKLMLKAAQTPTKK